MKQHVKAAMDVQSELRAPNAQVQLVHYRFDEPPESVVHMDSTIRVELCLTARHRSARACFTERWSANRFERIGEVFVVPPTIDMAARSVTASFTCGMTVQADNTAYVCGSEGYIAVPVPWKPPMQQAVYTVARSTPPKMDLAVNGHASGKRLRFNKVSADSFALICGCWAASRSAIVTDNLTSPLAFCAWVGPPPANTRLTKRAISALVLMLGPPGPCG